MNRRNFLKYAGTCIGWMGLPFVSLTPFRSSLAASKTAFEPDVEIYLEALPGTANLRSGPATHVWHYRGTVMAGPPDALDSSDRSYLGPTFRLQRGQKVRIRFQNLLPDETVIHWHGLHVPDTMDGHPRLAVASGNTYTYEFEVINRAGTYWYHPHPHGRTGHQVYGGLAGLFIVDDAVERRLNLPKGPFDIPLVLQDRTLDRENQLIYMPRGGMDRMWGMFGEKILVNGRLEKRMAVEARAYRMRVLNGSNARIYRLAWSDGSPLTVIGTDGGLLERPVLKEDVLLSPGERLELWADFNRLGGGSSVSLISRRLPEAALGPMMGAGTEFPLREFTIGPARAPGPGLPDVLTPMQRLSRVDADNISLPRQITLAMNHMRGTLNGRTFEMEAVARDEQVRHGDTEIWEFANDTSGRGMMRMPMPHPMHLHAVQFQVLDRWGVSHDSYVDHGWKDTVLVLPGERVQVIARFNPYKGLYLYHCHNLEHEDGGMMRNFLIV